MISYMLDGTTILGRTQKNTQPIDTTDSKEEKLEAAE
jgi:hypothetical protein